MYFHPVVRDASSKKVEPFDVGLFLIGGCEEGDAGFWKLYFLVIAPGSQLIGKQLGHAGECFLC